MPMTYIESDSKDEGALECKILAFFCMGPAHAADCVATAESLYTLDPSNPRNRMLRGDAYWLARRTDEAKTEYAAALAGFETNDSHCAAAWCALQIGNMAAAIDYYDQYLTEHPENLTAAVDRALAQLAVGTPAAVRETFDALIRRASEADPLRYRGALVFAVANIRARLPHLPDDAADFAHSVMQEMAGWLRAQSARNQP